MKKSIFILIVLVLYGCGTFDQTGREAFFEKNNGTQYLGEESQWISLFDGSSTRGWRGFNMDELPVGWVIEGETLKSLGRGGDIGGDIVYGSRELENFELYLEWKIADGGNSGIFYHVQEGEMYDAPYQTGPEYQVIDQLGYPGELEPWQSIAADYGMYLTDTTKLIVKEAGEWNTVRIIFRPEKVEHWLNGNKVLDFIPWSEDWHSKKESDKWKDYPDYGQFKKGLIGLQDHGSFVWYRNIKIKVL